jgi:hypothetical protein
LVDLGVLQNLISGLPLLSKYLSKSLALEGVFGIWLFIFHLLKLLIHVVKTLKNCVLLATKELSIKGPSPTLFQGNRWQTVGWLGLSRRQARFRKFLLLLS